jgi:mono/diheme cytochrome c family protein
MSGPLVRIGLFRAASAFALLVAIAAASAPAQAAAADAADSTVTFSADIAPIVYRRCAECHRAGDIAPMSLLTYDEVRPWAKSIKKAVVSGDMPPWDASPAVGHFKNDISLPKDEIDKIVAWVDAGAPEGDPAALPPQPTFPSGWRLGEPDAIVELPSFDVADQGADRFPSIFVELGNTETKYVRAVELHIGDRRVLHHMVLFQGPFAMTQDIVDTRSPGNRKSPLADMPKLLYVWAAGSPPIEFPEGMGHVLNANQVLTLNMHYHPSGKAGTDTSKLGLYYADKAPVKEYQTAVAIKPSLRIPANSDDTTDTAYFLFHQDSQVLSYLPHMHQRGAAVKYTFRYPDGRDEVVLDVPQYSYDWQWIYQLTEPKDVPAGTLLQVDARWDNSAANPRNPNPNVDLAFGEGTDDEMLVGFVDFVVKDGVRPAPVPVASELRRLMGLRQASTESYLGTSGMMSFGMQMPSPEGGGAFYLMQGNTLLTMDFHDVKWEGSTAIINSEMLTSSADTMPLGIVVERTPEGGIQGELFFGRAVSGAERASMAGTGQRFRGERLDSGATASGR